MPTTRTPRQGSSVHRLTAQKRKTETPQITSSCSSSSIQQYLIPSFFHSFRVRVRVSICSLNSWSPILLLLPHHRGLPLPPLSSATSTAALVVAVAASAAAIAALLTLKPPHYKTLIISTLFPPFPHGSSPPKTQSFFLLEPLQLLEPPHQNSPPSNRHEETHEEEFRILGYPMSLKHGKTEAESASSKWVAMESPLEARRAAVRSWGDQPISVADPEDFEIMEREKQRQFRGLELIASENFACRAVLEALRSHLTNNYSEGMPGTGYYGGNQYIDQIEQLCCKRALALFHLDPEKWGVNIQGYLCTSANLAVYTGLLLPKDRIMGLLDTHLSHGYYTPSGKKVSGASIFFESLPCKAKPQTGNIDYGKLEEKAFNYRPRILICSGCSCQREWNSARFGQIADKCVSVLMRGMAHISGLIAAKVRLNCLWYEFWALNLC